MFFSRWVTSVLHPPFSRPGRSGRGWKGGHGNDASADGSFCKGQGGGLSSEAVVLRHSTLMGGGGGVDGTRISGNWPWRSVLTPLNDPVKPTFRDR